MGIGKGIRTVWKRREAKYGSLLVADLLKLEAPSRRQALLYGSLLILFYNVVLRPAATLLFRLLLDAAHFSYIRLDNLTELFRLPIVLGTCILVPLLLLYLLFQQVFLTCCCLSAKPLALRATLRRIARSLRALRSPKNWLLFPVFLIYIPGNPYRVISNLPVRIGIPTFVIRFIYGESRLYFCYLAVLLLIVWLSSRYCLTFHYFFLEGLSAGQALRKSARCARPYRIELLASALLIQGCYFLVQCVSALAAGVFLRPLALREMRSESALLLWGALRSLGEVWYFATELLFFLFWLRLISLLYLRLRATPLVLPTAPPDESVNKRSLRRRLPPIFLALFSAAAFGLNSVLLSFNQLGLSYALLFRPEMKVMGHRGEADFAPENTLPALLSAMDHKAYAAEIDVQLSRDGVPVLLHDKSFLRTCGVNRRPGEMSLAEIRNLDAGERFAPFFKETKVPELREAVRLTRGKMQLNIELKPERGNEEQLAEAVARVLRGEKAVKDCMVSSLSRTAIHCMKTQLPELRCGLIVSFVYGSFEKEEEISFYAIESSSASRERVNRIHDLGKEVYVWTVNDGNSLLKAYENGADGVITDQVYFCREWLLKKESVRTEMLEQIWHFVPEDMKKKMMAEEAANAFPEAEPTAPDGRFIEEIEKAVERR